MAKKIINLTGTPNENYNLDEIRNDSRTNGAMDLIVQVYEYNKNESPNPPDLKVGQIWLSKLKNTSDVL